MKPSNLAPHPIHPNHFLLHALNAILVFGLGIAADVAIVHYLHNQPKTVVWQGGEVQEGFILSHQPLPDTNSPVNLGIASDGTLVWRVPKP